MKAVVITGATSFIGQHLIRLLLDTDDCDIYAIIRAKSRNIQHWTCHKNVHIFQLNMCEYKQLPNYINEADVFIHLAWDGTRNLARQNRFLQDDNYLYSIYALKSAAQLGVSTFVAAGSQAEYGQFDGILKETSFTNPTTEYGKSKLAFCQYATAFCNKNSMKFFEPRFFSLYGPGDFSGTLIMSTLKKMLINEECDFTDCEQMWDFLYIQDAVRGICKLIFSNAESGSYNFASGCTRPLKEFIYDMAQLTNTSSKLNFGKISHNDTGTYGIQPDISKMLAIGWESKVSFSEGIKNLILYLNRNE